MTSPSSSSIRRANSPACERARVMTIRLPKRRCRDFRLSALDRLSKAPLIALWLCSLFDSRLVASRLCRRKSVAENSTRPLLQQTLRQVVTQLNRVCTRPGDFITINRAPLAVRHNTDQVKGVAAYAPPGSNGQMTPRSQGSEERSFGRHFGEGVDVVQKGYLLADGIAGPAFQSQGTLRRGV